MRVSFHTKYPMIKISKGAAIPMLYQIVCLTLPSSVGGNLSILINALSVLV